jgi:hypothetical protein
LIEIMVMALLDADVILGERERGELPSCGTAEGSDPPEVGAVASRHWVGMTSGSCQAPVIEK